VDVPPSTLLAQVLTRAFGAAGHAPRV